MILSFCYLSCHSCVHRQVISRILSKKFLCRNSIQKFSSYQYKVQAIGKKDGFQNIHKFNSDRILLDWKKNYYLSNHGLHFQVSSFSTTSRNHREYEDPNDRDEKQFIKAGLFTLGFIWIIVFSTYAHVRKQNSTISWSTFIQKVLPSGEVDKILVSSQDVALVHLRQDALAQPGERMRRDVNEQRIVVLQGGFHNGVNLEGLLRSAEDDLKIDPNHRIPVMFNWELVNKEKENLETAEKADNLMRMISFTTVVSIVMLFLPWIQKRGGNLGGLFKELMKGKSEKGPTSSTWSNTKAKPTASSSSSSPPKRDNVKLDDVAGLGEAKQEVVEFVHFLKDPSVYTSLGAKMPKGCLLTGPPGCGKTLMARAVANEADVPFINKAGSDFVEMVGGLGAKRIRDLFQEARDQAPCIIFIDEIDAVGGARENDGGMGGLSGGREKSQTVNQLLVEMDGMLSEKYQVVVMAATNRPDMLDKALLRPGRFDRTIQLDLPALKDRQEILMVHLAKIKLEEAPEHYASKLAHMTPGMSGAELANICNEAAIYAARLDDPFVTYKHINYAIDRVMAGSPKTSTSVGPEERRIVAVHESGHVLVGWLLRHTDALTKVTIVPRTSGALGFAATNPTDRYLYSPDQILDIMCMALGGRAAESLIFKRITSGARDDLDKVTKMAMAQVKHFGFNSVVGELSFPQEQQQDPYRTRPFSDALTATMDRESRALVEKAYKRTEELLKANQQKLIDLSEELYKRENLDYDEVAAIIGPPPHGDKRRVQDIPLAPMADNIEP